MSAQKSASEPLGNFGNHSAMIAHREANGEAEIHERMTDIFIVESGSATLVAGGKVSGGTTTAPGEIRGKAIEGGVRKKLGPGDVVHIPANTPHQLLIEPGGRFTYMVFKIAKAQE